MKKLAKKNQEIEIIDQTVPCEAIMGIIGTDDQAVTGAKIKELLPTYSQAEVRNMTPLQLFDLATVSLMRQVPNSVYAALLADFSTEKFLQFIQGLPALELKEWNKARTTAYKAGLKFWKVGSKASAPCVSVTYGKSDESGSCSARRHGVPCEAIRHFCTAIPKDQWVMRHELCVSILAYLYFARLIPV